MPVSAQVQYYLNAKLTATGQGALPYDERLKVRRQGPAVGGRRGATSRHSIESAVNPNTNLGRVAALSFPYPR
jgi:hypothetical protein